MKLNLKNTWVLFATLLLGGVSYALGKCGVTRSCDFYNYFYSSSLTLFEPVFLFSLTVMPLALVLMFVRKNVLKKVLRFATIWIILSAVLIALAPRNSNSWMPLYPEPTKENLAWLLGGLLTFISLGIIARARRKKR